MDIFTRLINIGEFEFEAVDEDGDTYSDIHSWDDLEALGLDEVTVLVYWREDLIGEINIIFDHDMIREEKCYDYSLTLENL